MRSNSFRNTTIDGLFWSFINSSGREIGAIVFIVILSRILTPNDFGLVGMVTVFTAFSGVLLDFGFGQALIQKQNASQTDYSSVFWLNIAVGLLLNLVIIICAPLIVSFYDNEALYFLTILNSFTFTFTSLGIVQRVLLTKRMDFKTLAKVDIIAMLIAGCSAVILAYNMYGPTALVAQTLLLAIFRTALMWYYAHWRPSFKFELSSIRSIFNFSINLFGNSSFNYFTSNVDKLLIGKFLGGSELGLYKNAFSLVVRPIATLNATVYRVLFPSFSTIQDNLPKIKSVYLKMASAIFYIIGGLMTLLWINSNNVIPFIFGDSWIAMIPVFKVMCVTGIFFSLTAINANVFLALGRSDILFRINASCRVITIIGIIVGLYWGIQGVAYSLLITYAFWFVISNSYLWRMISINVRDYMTSQKLAGSLFAFLFVVGFLLQQFFVNYDLISNLLIVGFISVSIFSIMSYWLKPPAYVEVEKFLRVKIRSRS